MRDGQSASADAAARFARAVTNASTPAAGAPSVSRQRFDIARILAQRQTTPVKPGSRWSPVPAAWWRLWCAHVGGFSIEDDVAPCVRLMKASTVAAAAAAATSAAAAAPAAATTAADPRVALPLIDAWTPSDESVQREYAAMRPARQAASDAAAIEGPTLPPLDVRGLLAPLALQREPAQQEPLPPGGAAAVGRVVGET